MNAIFGLGQVRKDFENTKKRVILAQVMKAQGYSREEVEKAVRAISKPDMIDLLIEEFC